tara:strand:- start:447 stop:872 length:426 start_codon:yes stop_codon:yes gene_type:complete
MEIKTLNKEHGKILNGFINDVERFIYIITDDQNFYKFKNFKPVISNAKELHNNIGRELKSMNIDESEWVYMFPNYMLFAGIGFASAIKNKNNENLVNEQTEMLFNSIQNTINELEQMIDKRKFRREKRLKTKNQKQKQTND